MSPPSLIDAAEYQERIGALHEGCDNRADARTSEGRFHRVRTNIASSNRTHFLVVRGDTTTARKRLRKAIPKLLTASVETMGLEPTTPCLQSRCSSQLSYVPEGPSVAIRVPTSNGRTRRVTPRSYF
jgi:hypothetical protein